MRFVLDRSSIFDSPKRYYNVSLFKEIIKRAGGKNVRLSYNHGWTNQPKVITFNVRNNSTLSNIIRDLEKLPAFQQFGCIIKTKDW